MDKMEQTRGKARVFGRRYSPPKLGGVARSAGAVCSTSRSFLIDFREALHQEIGALRGHLQGSFASLPTAPARQPFLEASPWRARASQAVAPPRLKKAGTLIRLLRFGCGFAALCLLWLPQKIVAQSPVSAQRATINQYCIGCHNQTAKAAGLALDTLDANNVGERPELWEKVVRKLRGRMMPPPGRPRPDEAGYDSLVSTLEASLDRAAAAKPNPGRTDTFRRLTRTEYQNAIRDLLSIDTDVSSLLPKDDSSFGFDNVTVGGLSTTLLERYLAAAQKISRLAVGSPVRSPGSETVLLPADLTQEDHFDDLPIGTRGGTVVRHTFPLDAEYEIQIRLSRDRNENIEGLTEPHQLEITLDGERIQLFTVSPNKLRQQETDYADKEADTGLHARIPVRAGPHAIGVAFLKKTSALLETERQPYSARFNFYRHPRTQPAVYSVSVAGPFDVLGAGDTPSRRRIFVCRPLKPSEEEACARKIVSTLARRAYRRPITGADLQTPLAFYKDARAKGDFETGIEMTIRVLLTSPEFLFRVEQDPLNIAPNTAYRISDVELASRLSFFLWSSIPDDELLEAAIRGRLHDSTVLERQVRRMLGDPRSQSLVNNFAEQWLYLRNLAASNPDPRLFPDFDDNLRQAFRRETELFFESIVKEDRSALELLGANYTFLNERLAKHYGIFDVYGSHFRRVTLGDDSVRGGLLGQGSILTVTSYANRTSPVLRGKWVLENILGTPPPSPPSNVPPLKDNGAGKILSMRERMVQHRSNPACSGCHSLMDPIGLTIENFDAVGRWRIRTESGEAVDSSGGLPSGTTFEGVAGLKRALLNHPELFVSTLTEKLLTYALGRGIEHYDIPAVRTIARDARGNDYRFSALVAGIVKSTPFQMRRSHE
jgi:mono/diheme cytochrome c family protein